MTKKESRVWHSTLNPYAQQIEKGRKVRALSQHHFFSLLLFFLIIFSTFLAVFGLFCMQPAPPAIAPVITGRKTSSYKDHVTNEKVRAKI